MTEIEGLGSWGVPSAGHRQATGAGVQVPEPACGAQETRGEGMAGRRACLEGSWGGTREASWNRVLVAGSLAVHEDHPGAALASRGGWTSMFEAQLPVRSGQVGCRVPEVGVLVAAQSTRSEKLIYGRK